MAQEPQHLHYRVPTSPPRFTPFVPPAISITPPTSVPTNTDYVPTHGPYSRPTAAASADFPAPPIGSPLWEGPYTAGAVPHDQDGKSKATPSTVEFVVGPPRYLKRIAALLFVALFGIVPLMSSFSITVLLCGMVVVYMVDYLGYTRGTMIALVGTAVLFAVSLLLSNLHATITSLGPLLMIIDLCGVLACACSAAVLHFRGIQEAQPALICRLERLVMVLTPVLALPSILTTTTALSGSHYAPSWFLVAMCIMHYTFYGPLPSSFLQVRQSRASVPPTTDNEADRSEVDKRLLEEGRLWEDEVLVSQPLHERVDAIVFTILVITLPTAVYNALQSNWDDHVSANLMNSLGLLSGGLTYLSFAPDQSLWFFTPPVKNPDMGTQLAYDPLSLQQLVSDLRQAMLHSTALLGSFWCAYHVTNSRYAYVFNGLPFPINMLVLFLLSVAVLYSGVIIVTILEKVNANRKEEVRGFQMLLAVGLPAFSAASLSVVIGAPPLLVWSSAFGVVCFFMFLLDRTQINSMHLFITSSTLQLFWWMHRTFTFVVVDLRVFGMRETVSSIEVEVSILWCYLLGCICFTVSYTSREKATLCLFMFLHVNSLTFVEEVLYAQPEEGAYPAVFVLFTSALGATVVYRMLKNGILNLPVAAFIGSCYLAKTVSFLVAVTSSYYAPSDVTYLLVQWLLPMEMTCSWWAGLTAFYAIFIFEMERRNRAVNGTAKWYLYAYVAAIVALTLCTVRNVQRAVYEFVTRSYVSADELPHIAPGTAFVTFALLLWPFSTRQLESYAVAGLWQRVAGAAAGLGVVLLLVQPTRIVDAPVSGLDYELANASTGRYASAVGLVMLLGARIIPLHRLHVVLRAVYWLGAAAGLSFGISTMLLPALSIPLIGSLFAFVCLTFFILDMAHYRVLTGLEGWIAYSLLACSMVAATFALKRVNIDSFTNRNLTQLWHVYEQGQMQLLSIIAVTNLFVAVVLKARLCGKPLLPQCVPATSRTFQQLGVVTNYATLVTVVIMSVLNYWANDNEPGLYVITSLLLLLMTDDEVIFFDLSRGYFRYFPSVMLSLTFLWVCVCHGAWNMGTTLPTRMTEVAWACVRTLALVPAQASLLIFLWKSGIQKGRRGTTASTSTGSRILFWLSLALSLVVLVITSRQAVQWMSLVCVCGQVARIFEMRLRDRSLIRRKAAAQR